MFKKLNWRYAIGEIIIVIIGITIAFSLNNWAENAKDRSKKKEYLQSLILDVESEKSHLQSNIEQFETGLRKNSDR